MVGRLGHPNAGRLTTSAFLKPNKVSAAAINGFFRIPYKSAVMADRIGVSRTLTSAWNLGTVLSDGVGISEPYFEMLVTVLASLDEAVSVGDTLDRPVLGWEQIEAIDILDQLIVGQKIDLSETLRIVDLAYRDIGATATDSIGASDALRTTWGLIVRDLMRVSITSVRTLLYRPTVADTAALADSPTMAFLAALVDTIGFADATAILRGVRIIESLRLHDALASKLFYGLVASDSVRVSDALRRFWGGDLTDALAVSSVPVTQKLARPAVTDTVTAADSLTPKFFLRAIAADNLRVTDTQLLKMLFRPQLAEVIEIAAAYLSPGNDFTTWAINTKNAAVTEYSNYVFNSFAQAGHKYLGASDTGLYELNGDDDAGVDIIAHIKSGFAQFGGSRFTSFKAAYLGMRGEGDFILKVVTGDGKTYNYAVVGKDMETTKVHMGKGLRARYFAFELISTGQDFDLDDIEFVPLVAQRRV